MTSASFGRTGAVPTTHPYRALFLNAKRGGSGRRFAIHHPGRGGKPSGQILFVHAFADEMNKSRRMVALQARALADSGFEVLQLDLTGCGDSEGDFCQATWNAWTGDVLDGVDWLQGAAGEDRAFTAGTVPLWLWGHRAGCLVAVEAAKQLEQPASLLFWNPVTSGKVALQQFLRLRVASEMLDSGEKGVMDRLRQDLKAGRSVDVAGYRLSPDLAGGMEAATLTSPFGAAKAIWLEVSPQTDMTISPAAAVAAARWEQAGWVVQAYAVQGPAFWQTTEIEDAPSLLAATTHQMRQASTTSPPVAP